MAIIDSRKWVSRGISVFHYFLSKCKVTWDWYKHLYHNAPWYKRVSLSAITFIFCFLVYLGMVDINFLGLFGKSPSMSSIHNPNQPVASEIYSADGKLIGKFFRHYYLQSAP